MSRDITLPSPCLDEYKCDYSADYGYDQLHFDAPQQGAYHRYQAACRQTECRYHGSEQFYDNEYGCNDEPQEPTWYDYVHRNLKSDRFSEVMCLLFMYKYNGNIDKLKGYRYFL